MKVAVWDTYVKRTDGRVMHFDIILPEEIKEESVVFSFGREYLTSIGQGAQALTSRECRFCHIEKPSKEVEQAISEKGYYILEMENCD